MAGKGIVFTSEIAESKADRLLRRITNGERVTAEERLDIITDILAFSPRDWSTDAELWLLYRVALNDGSKDEL
ncbi:MAG: hypothetical protein AAB461_01795 [Patescibacteria group bacterium]